MSDTGQNTAPAPFDLGAALARAAELAERLTERRAKTEELRRLPDETVEEFVDSGLLRINQAARFGGAEAGMDAALSIVSEVAKGDAAAGWVFGLLGSHFWLGCLFPDEAQQEMWGTDPSALMSSSFVAKESRCERVAGGYQVSGVWPFSSGSVHAHWAMIGIMLPPEEPNGPPHIRWGLLPRTDYDVADDWRTVAMRGTASNSLLVDGAFLPDHRCINPFDVGRGQAPGADVNSSPLYRLPFSSALVTYLVGPALGGAARTLDEWATYIATKRSAFTGEEIGKQAPTLIRIGEATAQMDAATTLMHSVTQQVDETWRSGGRVGPELGVRVGRSSAYVVRLCVDVVDAAMRWSGGNALYETHPVQQGWRDVHGVSAHLGFNTDMAYSGAGRMALGLPLPPSMF